MRKPRPRGSLTNKKVRNAKEHIFNGIKFRSGLELFCYKALIADGIDCDYEKRRYILMDKFTHNLEGSERLGSTKKVTKFSGQAIAAITYKPDFVDRAERWLIETKGMCTGDFILRWKLFKRYLAANGSDMVIYLPRTQAEVIDVIIDIKKRFYE